MPAIFPFVVNACLSAIGIFLSHKLIQKCKEMFIKSHLFGIDMSKKNSKKIPESQGVIIGTVFLIIMFVFIPVPFSQFLTEKNPENFPHHKFIEYIAVLLSICCMIFLGFADDVLDLRWRHKLLLPTIASLPLLMVYYVNFGKTVIIIPKPFREIFGFDLDLHLLYYVYMGMLAVFSTNAINILAGVNGLEVGQSLVIAISVLIFNIIEIMHGDPDPHELSVYFLFPYTALSGLLLWHNWYPAQVFVGDTFCYFSGMTFAVVAILGHFSKTLLLFFIPQIFNFLYSVPQLFHFIPCPRHRLPKYDPEKDTLKMSVTTFELKNINIIGQLMLKILHTLRLVRIHKSKPKDGKKTEQIECNNLTLLNLVLYFMGPLHEKHLVTIILGIQVVCSIIAFLIRYQLAKVFY